MTEKPKSQFAQWWDGFVMLMENAKNNAPTNHGFSVSFKVGDVEGSIEYTAPTIRWQRGGPKKEPQKKVTEDDLKAIVAEYPADLEYVERPGKWILRAKNYPFDDWRKVMDKVNKFEGGDWADFEGEPKKVWVMNR